MNPEFTLDIDILQRLLPALRLWADDIKETNNILGLPEWQ